MQGCPHTSLEEKDNEKSQLIECVDYYSSLQFILFNRLLIGLMSNHVKDAKFPVIIIHNNLLFKRYMSL